MEKRNVVEPYMEYDSGLERKKTLAHATTWMNLEDIIIRKSQLQNDKYYVIVPIWDIKSSQTS